MVVFLAPIQDKTAEIFSEDSYYICPSNLYIVLYISLLLGVLDRFLDFQVFVFFSIPLQDRGLKISGINYD